MTIKATLSGAAIATTAAALFAIAPVAASASDMVKCIGANSCKGLSACKTAQSPGPGKNSCKGQGLAMLTKEQCMHVGGKVAD